MTAALVALSCVPLPLPLAPDTLPFAVSVVQPDEVVVVGAPNQEALVRWVDTGTLPGSVIRVEVERPDPNGGDNLVRRILVGRDAVADDAADQFLWDGTDVDGNRVEGASYTVRVIMDGPNGENDDRTAANGSLVVPFTFRGVGFLSDEGSLANNGGAGPFVLTDTEADFINEGVVVGRTVSILAGSGAIIGDFEITDLSATTLTFAEDAGDSGGLQDVLYFVSLPNPVVNGADDAATVAWTDSEPASTIQLAADPDTNPTNGNEIVLAQNINVALDGDMDRYQFTGRDVNDVALAPGVYRIVATIDRATISEQTIALTTATVTLGNAPPTLDITSPATNITVGAGGIVNIVYTATDPDDDATITFTIDPDTDETDPDHDSGNETVIETDIQEIDGQDTYAWNTTGTGEGVYTIIGSITDGESDPVTDTAQGRVTLGNSPPQVTVLRPSGEMAAVMNNGGSGPFELTDPAFNFEDEGVSASDTVEITGGTGATIDTFSVEDVLSNTLTLDADAGDSGGVMDVSYEVTGNISIIAGDTFDLRYETLDPEDNFTFDFILDYDNENLNGNEIIILNNRAAPMGGPTEDVFSWDTTGIELGSYRLLALSDDGNTMDAEDVFPGRVLIRTATNEPFMVLTLPTGTSNPTVGSEVTVDWDDESTDENTRIDLVYDDDANPNESSETDEDERVLFGSFAMNIDGDADGASDIFRWDWHPDDITKPAVAEGEYRIFGYINNDVVAFGNTADLENAGGGGPYMLLDDDADFVNDGVTTSHMVRVGGGTGADPGLYSISAVTATELTLGSDAGDSAGSGDVAYNVDGPRDLPDNIAVAPGKINIPNTEPELEFRRPFGQQATLAPVMVLGDDYTVLTDVSADFLARGVTVGDSVEISGDADVEDGDYEIMAVTATTLTVEGDAGDTMGDADAAYDVMGDFEAEPGTSPDLAWFDRDPDEASISIDLFLDPDTTRTNDNEIQIANNLNKTARPDVLNVFNWTGTDDIGGMEVESGVFNMYATLDDGVNDPVTVTTSDQVILRFDDDVESGAGADVANGAGSGPFTLTDGAKDFVAAGVEVGDIVRIGGGTGATPGLFSVAQVATTVLTLRGDAGDSGAAGDVMYAVFMPNPVIVLLSQTEDVTVTQGSSVTIRWTDLTVSGTEKIGLYYDEDNDPTSGGSNGGLGELIENNLPAAPDIAGADQFVWDLPLGGGDFVPEGTYYIHARLVDGGVQKDISTSRGTVEVTGPNIPPTLEFLAPASTVDTVLGGAAFDITWEYTSGTAGTITLELDQDQTGNNGEQFTILDNRPQAGAPTGTTDTLNFDLNDSMGSPVPTGRYFLRGRLAVSGQSPATEVPTNRIIIRKTAGAPVMNLTAPTTDVELTEGNSTTIQIEWTRSDPSNAAVVDLWYDTSSSSDGGAAPPRDGAFIVQDQAASSGIFIWNVPNSLAQGLYYIHARIEEPAGDDDDRSTAIGRLRVIMP